MALAACGPTADATDLVWTNGAKAGDRQWGTASNWSPNTVPNNASCNAIFTNRPSSLTNIFTLNGTAYALTGVTPANAPYSIGQLNFATKPPGNDGWYIYCNPGATSLLTVNGDSAANPVIILGAGCTAANITGQALQLALGLSGPNEIQVNGALLRIEAPIVGGDTGAGLNKTGPGVLVLTNTGTYTGSTLISSGTLQLAGGSLDSSSLISIAAGATLDVSSAPFALSPNTAISANGLGTVVGVNAAAIKGKGGTLVSLGAQPITLNYDGAHPALYILQGALSLGGNAFTVNSASPLAPGSYVLIQQAVGNIISFGPCRVAGNAIGPETIGVLSIVGAQVILSVVVPATIRVETAADGSGTVVPAQSLSAGSSLTAYAVARAADGSFLANVPASWSLVEADGGIVGGDLAPAADSQSAIFTAHLLGGAIVRAAWGGLTSTTPVSPVLTNWQKTGASRLMLAGTGAAEMPYSVYATTNGLAPSSDWFKVGSVTATASGGFSFTDSAATNLQEYYRLTAPSRTDSGALTVIPGPAIQVRVETAADGSGVLLPTQSVASECDLTLYAITRDAWGNFVANAPADSWTLVNTSGGVTSGDLSPASGPSAVFYGHAPGAGQIHVSLGGLASVDSGLITVVDGTTRVWSATPANYQWDTSSANWVGGSGVFNTGAAVRFSDSGAASFPIMLVGSLNPASVTVDASAKNYSFAGSGHIAGSGGLVKAGSSTLTLANVTPYTYSGDTLVQAGTLLLNGTLGHPDSTITVMGGTGVLGGNGTVRSAVQVLADGTLAPGAGGVGLLTVSNNLTLAGRTIMKVNAAAYTNDSVVATGTLTLGGTLVLSNLATAFYMGDSFTLFQAGFYSGSFAAISPTTPGNGLVWDTNSLAVDGTLLVMGATVTNDACAYAGYDIKASSRFNAYNSLVNRPYPLYDYSVNLLKVGSSYMAVTGDRYIGSGEDGDHIFGWTSPAGQPGTWVNIDGAGSSAPLFLKSDSYNANTMDPELIYNPANGTWYLYVQKQSSEGDRIMALTSTDRRHWTAYTSRPVIVNTPTNRLVFHHEEVIYVPWSSKPFWLYAYLQVDGVNKGYKLFQSNDPLAFDYEAQIDSGGESNLGGQRGYLQEAQHGPLFVRITQTGGLPMLQFSTNGTSWTGTGSRVFLASSSDTGAYKNCYFPGISTINGNGALEYLGRNRWRAIYAATTAASPTAPDIFNSEIGCGEVVIDLN